VFREGNITRKHTDVRDRTSRRPARLKFGVGQPVTRLEDARLLKGRGRYQDDINLPVQLHAVFLRSPHAHARIKSIATSAAATAPGVHAFYTGSDYAADGLAMPKAAMPRKNADGSAMFAPRRPALVIDRARYVGDPVAMIIAETLAQAKDAAELVEVDYEPMPAVTSTADAALPDAPWVWNENPDNTSHTYERGDKAKTEAAFARARHVVRRRYVISRVQAPSTWSRAAPSAPTIPARIGTRSMPTSTTRTVSATCWRAWFSRCLRAKSGWSARMSAAVLAKNWQYVEHRLTLWAAKTHGQGHKTAFKQILCERPGLDPGDIQYIDGNTDRVAFGMGSNGSRSMVVGGSALTLAAGKVIGKGKRLAAHLLEAAETDLEFADGKFTVVGTDRTIALTQVARTSFQPARLPPGMEPGLYEHATYAPERATSPMAATSARLKSIPNPVRSASSVMSSSTISAQ
jgi:CO/xanthine dehydrogenase Mo-binding subunit